MSKIPETKKKTKTGIDVTLSSPEVGEGAALLETVKVIMEKSAHLLTTAEEFRYTVEQEDELIKAYLAHPDKVMIVPKINHQIVGMMNFECGARKRIAHQGEFGMSVHPDFQGQGIGRMMLQALIQWAQINPRIETLRLSVHAKNLPAIALYTSFHFREEGRELSGVKLSENNYDDVVLMALDVSSPDTPTRD